MRDFCAQDKLTNSLCTSNTLYIYVCYPIMHSDYLSFAIHRTCFTQLERGNLFRWIDPSRFRRNPSRPPSVPSTQYVPWSAGFGESPAQAYYSRCGQVCVRFRFGTQSSAHASQVSFHFRVPSCTPCNSCHSVNFTSSY